MPRRKIHRITARSSKKKPIPILKKTRGAIQSSATKIVTPTISKPVATPKPIAVPQTPPFETILLAHLTDKQRNAMSKEFCDKINGIGKALIALAYSRKEFLVTDAKVAQLEKTYGKTMKIHSVWQYQERAGLAGILGIDPQRVMDSQHCFKDDQRLLYYSCYPRNPPERDGEGEMDANKAGPSKLSEEMGPPSGRTRTRARAQMLARSRSLSELARIDTDDDE